VSKRDPVDLWAAKITTAWRDSVEAIVKVGQLLIDARAALKDDEKFGRMVGRVGTDKPLLPFGYRTAYRLMAIARDERLVTHVAQMPPSVGHLYELSRLDDSTFAFGIERKLIHPDMQRDDVGEIAKIAARAVPLFDGNVPLSADPEQPRPDDFADVERVFSEAAIILDRLTPFLEKLPTSEIVKWRAILMDLRDACDGGLALLNRPAREERTDARVLEIA